MVEDNVPSHHLRSEYPYPNGFLLLSTHLFLCEPRTLAIGLGERLRITRRVRLLSVVLPALGLPSLLCGLVASVVIAVELIQAGEVDG